LTILSVLYDTGARVQELCDLKVRDIRLEKPAMITLTGRGSKTRNVPILGNTVALLKQYMDEKNILKSNSKLDFPLFFNQRYEKLSRGGVNYILKKYSSIILKSNPCQAFQDLTPHVLRHYGECFKMVSDTLIG